MPEGQMILISFKVDLRKKKFKKQAQLPVAEETTEGKNNPHEKKHYNMYNIY